MASKTSSTETREQFSSRLGGQKAIPRIAVIPIELGRILGMIVGDGEVFDRVAPERRP